MTSPTDPRVVLQRLYDALNRDDLDGFVPDVVRYQRV
jgi:hypothetical protein